MLSGGSRTVPTSAVTCAAYEHSLSLIRQTLKTQVPMSDHYFSRCCDAQLKKCELSLEDREDAVVCALFIGAMDMIPDPFPYRAADRQGDSVLEEIVEYVLRNVSKCTNDVPYLLKKFTLFFTTNFDLYRPMLPKQRGHVLSRVLGMLESARCNANGEPAGNGTLKDDTNASARTVNVSEPFLSMDM